MATENQLWGAERIRGELLKLGVRIAKRAVQRYMRGARPAAPRGGQTWRTFLRNHTVDVNAKRVVHVAVTRAPTQAWTAQQLRNATPFGQGPQFLVRDRDDKFGAIFDHVAKGAGARVVPTAVQAPLMNSVCERFLGSVRRECLDHIIILSEPHLHHVLAEYALRYFNTVRPHQGIDQRTPVAIEGARGPYAGSVAAVPVLGGLHHEYRAAASERRNDQRSQHSSGLRTPLDCEPSAARAMHDDITMNTSDALQTLILACVDDDRTLRHERTFVDAERAEALTRLATEREQFVEDLERLGERPHRGSDGSWGQLLREAGRSVWVTAAGRNVGDAIATCRHSRARTEARYDVAMQRPWPDEIRRVLQAQRRRLHDEADALNQLQF